MGGSQRKARAAQGSITVCEKLLQLSSLPYECTEDIPRDGWITAYKSKYTKLRRLIFQKITIIKIITIRIIRIIL